MEVVCSCCSSCKSYSLSPDEALLVLLPPPEAINLDFLPVSDAHHTTPHAAR